MQFLGRSSSVVKGLEGLRQAAIAGPLTIPLNIVKFVYFFIFFFILVLCKWGGLLYLGCHKYLSSSLMFWCVMMKIGLWDLKTFFLHEASTCVWLYVSFSSSFSLFQHMIADTVRLIRHCQTDQTGESPAFRRNVSLICWNEWVKFINL